MKTQSNSRYAGKIDPRRAANLDTRLVMHRESEALLDRVRPALSGIIELAPQAITLHPVAQSREVWLRFRGLPFARWEDGRVFFGIGDVREELNGISRSVLKQHSTIWKFVAILSPRTRAIRSTARSRNAGLSLLCVRTSRVWMRHWIGALPTRRFWLTPAENTAFWIC